MSATAALIPVGTRRVHKGKAQRLIRVGHRSCARNQVRARLTSRLRAKAKRVTLYVNGQRRTVLTGGELRSRSITLKRIAPKSNGRVVAIVHRKSGGRAVLKSTSWPCR